MLVVITGATASGKSAFAMALAQRHDGVVINADTSQLYRDLQIVSARPSPADEARVPHRLYGTLDGDTVATAADWAKLARADIADAHADRRLPILVGGTGMYIATLINGIAPMPNIDPCIRAAVRDLAPGAAAAALAAEDAEMAGRLHPADRQRIARALEVIRSTGRSLLHWQANREGGIGKTMDVRGMVVEADRAVLNARAEARLWQMVEAGALAEVAALMARRLMPDRPVLRALGVREFARVIAGECDLAAAVAAAASATRQYQKRQVTWARNQFPGWGRATGDSA
jgi:tRNA dimethylallyltransferase